MGLKSLIRSLGALEKKLSSFEHIVNTIDLQNEDVLFIVNSQLEKLVEMKAKSTEIESGLCNLADEFEVGVDEELDRILKLEDDFGRLKVRLNSLKSKIAKPSEPSDCCSNSSLKLAKIPLPEFDGNITNFANFKSQFESLVSSNNSLSAFEKLHYLNSSLKGEIRNIQSPHDTFDSLFKVLNERFDNNRLVADTHITAILNVERLTHESGKDLSKFIDFVLNHLRGLTLLNLELNKMTELFLINIVVTKLDRESRRQYEMSLSGKSSDLPAWDEFIEFLQKRSRVLENIQAALPSKQKSF